MKHNCLLCDYNTNETDTYYSHLSSHISVSNVELFTAVEVVKPNYDNDKLEKKKQNLKQYLKKYRKVNKDSLIEYRKKYYEKNKDKVKERVMKHYYNKKNSIKNITNLTDVYQINLDYHHTFEQIMTND
jgi:hypothetical protein